MKKSLVCICSELDAKYYLQDWILYHKKLGYDQIYVYLNNVLEITKNMLYEKDYNIPVTYRTIDGSIKQLEAYNDFLRHNDSDFATIIDVDEYMKINSFLTLDQIFQKYSQYPALCVNWRLFGSSGKETYEPQPVYDRFKMCEKNLNKHIKIGIINLKLLRSYKFLNNVKFTSPHNLNIPSYNQNGNKIIGPFNIENLDKTQEIELYHYITKSKAECKIRRSMARADTNKPREEGWLNFFKNHDKNEINVNDLDYSKFL